MWKKIVEIGWGLLRLVDDTRQNRHLIETVEKRLLDLASETERDNTQLRRANEMLAFEVQRLRDELQRQQASEAAERRILKLELENHLLRQERGLPAAQPETRPRPDEALAIPNETDVDKA
jgi:serine phosphatase RsbU (regulator of sigma subunit)